jgi:hypothetical protein
MAALEGLPLAIQVAGRLLMRLAGRPEGQLSGILRKLGEDGAALLSEKPPANMNLRIHKQLREVADETTPTVAALLKLSTDLLSDEERNYFALLGVRAPKPATFKAESLARILEVADPWAIADKLRDVGLIQETGDKRYHIHALLVALAKSFLVEDS